MIKGVSDLLNTVGSRCRCFCNLSILRCAYTTIVLLAVMSLTPANGYAIPNIQKYKVIRIYTSYDFPPYEYMDEDGVGNGYSIDIIHEVMKNVNLPYTITLASWHDVLQAYDEGKVDIILGMSYSAARAKKYHFGMSYASLYESVVYRRGDGPYYDLSKLKGKKVMVNKSDVLEEVADSAHLDKEIIPMTNSAEGLKMLSEGKVDAVMCSREVALYQIAKNGLDNLDLNNLPVPPMEYRYSGKDKMLINELDKAFMKVKRDGVFEKLYRKWFIYDTTNKVWNIIGISVLSLLVCCGIMFSFIYILRRKVEKAKRIIGLQSKNMKLALHAGGVAVWKYDVKKKLFFNVESDCFEEGGSRMEDVLKQIHPDDHKLFVDTIGRLSNGENINDKVMIKMSTRRDESFGYIENEYALIFDEQGNVETVVGSFRDVTDMIVTQGKLKESMTKMEFIINASGLILWELDSKTLNFSSYNETLLDNNRAWNLSDVDAFVHPDDRENVHNNIESLRDGDNKSISFDLRVKAIEATEWRNCSITAIPFVRDNHGKVIKYVGFRRDNTEVLKKAEDLRLFSEKINYVLKSSKIIIWEYDIKSHIITMYDGLNSVVEVISCYEYFDRLKGKDRDDAVDLYTRMDKGLVESFSNIRELDEPLSNGGDTQFAIFNGLPLYDGEHHVKSYFGLRRDITELIETQHRLEAETEKAKVADKLKSAFLANMSHEIRTPLNAIVGFSNMLPSVADDKERTQFIQIINTNNELLLHLIDDILYLSKIESGVMEINNTEFDLADTFNIVSKSLQQRCTNPDVKFISDNPYSKCIIVSDNNRMVQLITNFTTNALKNTPRGHVKIGYKCDDDGVTLYVEDTGVGIPEDKIGDIFKRFEKLNEFVQGTGLGLSICKAISDSWNGKVWVESKPGKGSTFYSWVPCKVIERF
jgi:signal transduction histidine kinase/ABC-type amino acid transport substrate-binding protein